MNFGPDWLRSASPSSPSSPAANNPLASPNSSNNGGGSGKIMAYTRDEMLALFAAQRQRNAVSLWSATPGSTPTNTPPQPHLAPEAIDTDTFMWAWTDLIGSHALLLPLALEPLSVEEARAAALGNLHPAPHAHHHHHAFKPKRTLDAKPLSSPGARTRRPAQPLSPRDVQTAVQTPFTPTTAPSTSRPLTPADEARRRNILEANIAAPKTPSSQSAAFDPFGSHAPAAYSERRNEVRPAVAALARPTPVAASVERSDPNHSSLDASPSKGRLKPSQSRPPALNLPSVQVKWYYRDPTASIQGALSLPFLHSLY